jgi:hypothetical protein
MRCTVLANRRKTRRFSVRMPCQVVRERDFRLISDTVVNLSMSGMVVVATHWIFGQSLSTGDRFLVSFQVPRRGYWIDTEVTVTRVGRGRRRGEDAPTIALAFDPLAPVAALMLRYALRRLPPAPPQSRPGRRRTAASTEALTRPVFGLGRASFEGSSVQG